jgi:hypothetical protein
MITYSKLKSSTIENGKRILKVLQFGTKTAKECAPFGFDSAAPENMTAIFSETSNAGESVIIGYINKNQLAEPGESRMYSVDSTGAVKAYIFAKKTGEVEINGNENFAVRFDPLNDALIEQQTKINTELINIAAAISALGGTYINISINTNFETAKSETVKLK